MSSNLTACQTKELEVYTSSIVDFFEQNIGEIALPDYQRPYIWNQEKIEQLLQDWVEHFFVESNGNLKLNSDAPCYYLGTVLFHKEYDEKFHIIDGQQRITTLLIIDHAVNGNSSTLSKGKWNLNYNSRLSRANIKKNFLELSGFKYFKTISDHLAEIYRKLVLSVIITKSEDDAFTFFDSQNNRGVSLDAVDFLKSFHLRELKGKDKEQEIFVKKWDSSNAGQFLNHLFEIILWRSRNWKGRSLQFENKDLILHTFQKKTKKSTDHLIKLYSNVNNKRASLISFSAQKGMKLELDPLFVQVSPEEYPFTLRQPIQRGVGFFLYTEKYYHLFDMLFQKKANDIVNDVVGNLIIDYNLYFQNFFKLLVIMYYDRFKEEKLWAFMLWADYLLGAFRINQATIVEKTPIKILRDSKENLLDVIESSYDPDDVISFIREYTISGVKLEDIYNKPLDQYGSINGIRNNYRKTVLKYYMMENNTSELSNKYEWIFEKLKNAADV